MNRVLKALRSPGSQHKIEVAAPTQTVTTYASDQEEGANATNDSVYILTSKPRLLDRWLDKVVRASGSEASYFTILTILLIWALFGIRFGQSNTWQILISNAQAIINMVFDAFLMRQQLNTHEALLSVSANLRSRITSHKRMLSHLIARGKRLHITPSEFNSLPQPSFATSLPEETWMERISTKISDFMGHIGTVIAFWIGIFIWVGFGAYCQWSNTWQLYINSSTSALMVFILAFLANIRERHTKYMTRCLSAIWEVDSALELKLRTMTGDKIPNPVVSIDPHPRTRIQHGIDYYADLVGTLVGIAILASVIIVWVAIGPVLHFNANWWLLIGTYAGLIGLNDGFVLRNVCTVLGDYESEHFANVGYDDADLLALLGVDKLQEEKVKDTSFTCRVSVKVGDVCSHEMTVIGGVVVTVGLIAGASAMGWSETGQLLCNVPPSIIESFFTMILITGHNIGDQERRVDLFNVYKRRLMLVSYVDALAKAVVIEDVEGVEFGEEKAQVGGVRKEVCEVVEEAVEEVKIDGDVGDEVVVVDLE